LGGTIALLFLLAALSSILFLTPITRDFPCSAVTYVLLAVAAIPLTLPGLFPAVEKVMSHQTRRGSAPDG
jgi:hypothetical protein